MPTKKTHCRLVWEQKSNGFKGNGDWFPITQKNILEQWVKSYNEKYPSIIHLIEEK